MIRLSHNLDPQRAMGGFAALAGGQPAWAGTEQFVRQSAKRAWAEKARTAGTGGTSVSLARSSLRVVNPLKEARWDERVRHYPAAEVFHGSAWAAVAVMSSFSRC